MQIWVGIGQPRSTTIMPVMLTRIARRPAGELWRSPAFLRLWAASAVSAAGDQVTRLALPILAVTTLGAGPFHVGLLLTFEQLPQLLFTLVAGAWIDRLPKRPVIMICDAGRALVLLAVPVAAWLDMLSMPGLYAIGFLAGVFTTWHMIAWQSLLPMITPGSEMIAGASAITQVEAMAEVAGPVAGGGLVQLVGAPAAVLIDAVSFAGSAALTSQIKVDEPPARSVQTSILSEIRAGFRYLFSDPILRAIGLSGGLGVFFFSIREPLLRVFLLDTKGLSAGRYGLVFTVAAIGFAIGAFLPGPVARRVGVGNAIVWPNVGLTLTAIGIALAVMLDWHAVAVISAMLFLEGVIEPTNNINQLSLRLALMPREMRGRLTSVVRFLIRGAYPLGALVGGAVGEWIGIDRAIWLAVLGGPLGMAAYLGTSILHYRHLPAVEVEASAEA
jgi:MFS family permease